MTGRGSTPKRKVTYVTLAGNDTPAFIAPSLASGDPRAEAIHRLEAQIARGREQDRKVAEKNANVTRIDDPTAKVTHLELVSAFDTTQNDTLNTLARLFVEQASGLASVQSVQDVIARVVGESVDLDLVRTNKLMGMLSEVKFIQVLTKSLELEPEIRSHLLTRYIDREWGPVSPPPVIVKTETNSSSMPKRSGPATAGRPPSGEDRPKPAARGNMSVGPFGAIPNSR